MDWMPWLTVIHLVALFAWMAGIFYLPRLFVYHADTPVGTPQSETFKVMERRLFYGIMTPSMIVAWLAGIALATIGGFWSDLWLSLKLVFVLAITFFHVWLGWRQRAFMGDRNTVPSRTYRLLNELPLLGLVAIVILVIVKPF